MTTAHGWYAWYNKMPKAADGKLRITGHLEHPTSGYSSELVEGNAGIHPDPAVEVLRLVITPPADGDGVIDVVTTEPVSVERDVAGKALVRIDGIPTDDGTRSEYIVVEIVY